MNKWVQKIKLGLIISLLTTGSLFASGQSNYDYAVTVDKGEVSISFGKFSKVTYKVVENPLCQGSSLELNQEGPKYVFSHIGKKCSSGHKVKLYIPTGRPVNIYLGSGVLRVKKGKEAIKIFKKTELMVDAGTIVTSLMSLKRINHFAGQKGLFKNPMNSKNGLKITVGAGVLKF